MLEKKIFQELGKAITLQSHHVYSTLKRRGHGRSHVVLTWNTRGVFVGYLLLVTSCVKRYMFFSNNLVHMEHLG